MGVTHDFECVAHGVFESRAKHPKCPKGCSPGLVRKVFLQPVGVVSGRTRTSDRLVKEMAEMQGLSDISTNPSRPGGSVADRLRKKNTGMMGNGGRQYPEYAAAQAVPFSTMKTMQHKANELSNIGIGHKYDKKEWKKDDKSGAVKHVGAQPAIHTKPLGTTGVSVQRVKEDA